MKYSILTLRKEINLIKEGLKTWGNSYPEQKKRQEKRLKELTDTIKLIRSNIKNK